MADFLTNLVAKNLNPAPAVMPRPLSLFERPPRADSPWATPLPKLEADGGTPPAGKPSLAPARPLGRVAQAPPGTPEPEQAAPPLDALPTRRRLPPASRRAARPAAPPAPDVPAEPGAPAREVPAPASLPVPRPSRPASPAVEPTPPPAPVIRRSRSAHPAVEPPPPPAPDRPSAARQPRSARPAVEPGAGVAAGPAVTPSRPERRGKAGDGAPAPAPAAAQVQEPRPPGGDRAAPTPAPRTPRPERRTEVEAPHPAPPPGRPTPAPLVVQPQVIPARHPEPAVHTAGPATRPAEATPTIQVSIGRIEVRAVPPPPASAKPRAGPAPMTLEEYLRQRNGGGKG
jgi:hypothetical protein